MSSLQLAIVGIFASALLSWLITRYYYRRSDKKRVPTIIVQTTNTLSEAALTAIPEVTLRHRGLDIGREGINEATIYFWNSGTLPIRKDEVLELYTVTLPGRILAHSVLKSTRAVVAMLARTDANAPDTLTFDFAVMEPGDGATVRVVYDGPRTKAIIVGGACLDLHRPMILPPNPIYSVPIAKRFRDTYGGIGLLLLVVSGAGATVAGLGWATQRLFGARAVQIFAISFFGLLLVGVGAGVVINVWEHFKRMTAPYLPPDVKE
jgi:hypothetical protein